MNRKLLSILFFTGLIVVFGTVVHAQKPTDVDVNKWMAKSVIVNGNSEEWHEPLNNFNSETKLAFALGNDEENLYIVIESLDEVTTGKLMRGGLTLNINTAGKKKDGIKLNFLGMRQHSAAPGDLKDSAHRNAEKSGHDGDVKQISVSGFKNIPDGSLTVPNDAGIQVAAAFNERRDYICELAIPLKQLNLDGKEAKGIMYQIKINNAGGNPEQRRQRGESSERPQGEGMGGAGKRGGGGRKGGGGRGGMHAEDEHTNTAKSDFWIKYQLARAADQSIN